MCWALFAIEEIGHEIEEPFHSVLDAGSTLPFIPVCRNLSLEIWESIARSEKINEDIREAEKAAEEAAAAAKAAEEEAKKAAAEAEAQKKAVGTTNEGRYAKKRILYLMKCPCFHRPPKTHGNGFSKRKNVCEK